MLAAKCLSYSQYLDPSPHHKEDVFEEKIVIQYVQSQSILTGIMCRAASSVLGEPKLYVRRSFRAA